MNDGLRLAMVVHGRFHAFDVARELLRLGHDVTVFTNYPGFIAQRFGVPPHRVRSFLTHAVASRIAWQMFPQGLNGWIERYSNLAFGRWAARQVMRQDWDAVIAFSGVAEEVFRAVADRPILRVLQRGSAHIRVQQRILQEEERRCGCWLSKPSDWIVAREEREYALADIIHVLSYFAVGSFTAQGFDAEKLFLLHLGVSTERFRPRPEVIQARCQRILAGEPLRILNVGTFSYQKGLLDIARALAHPSSSRFRFRFVGPIAPEARALWQEMKGRAKFIPKRPQRQLPREYEWGDVFLLSTVQDGFAVVLCQALAAGLPLIATPNCGGPDLIFEGKNGWLIPIRNAQALIDRLEWLDAHREELVAAIQFVYHHANAFHWSDTARQAERNLRDGLCAKRKGSAIGEPQSREQGGSAERTSRGILSIVKESPRGG